jgi:hypothetical protein
MFVTTEGVTELTGKEVTLDLIRRAQGLIESYTGMPEVLVENTKDSEILRKMTAYQCAYMLENESIVWDQVAVTAAGSGESVSSFRLDLDAPYMSPLAMIASRKLSIYKSKSVHTGRVFQYSPVSSWKKD